LAGLRPREFGLQARDLVGVHLVLAQEVVDERLVGRRGAGGGIGGDRARDEAGGQEQGGEEGLHGDLGGWKEAAARFTNAVPTRRGSGRTTARRGRGRSAPARSARA